MNTVEFGFLAKPVSADFSEFSISPMDDYAAKLKWINDNSNADGFYYTPIVTTYELDPDTHARKRKVDRSERPAQSFHLPSSHKLIVRDALVKYPRVDNDESLIIYLLAFIFGTRLQRSEWRFDGRVPIVRQDSFSINDDIAIDFVLHTYKWWKGKNEDVRLRLVSILHSYSRACSIEFEWDSFPVQYMVFDALFKLESCLPTKSKKDVPSHKLRFSYLLKKYEIGHNEITVELLRKERNSLIHEALLASAPLGFAAAGGNEHLLPMYLARLNARLICCVVGYNNRFSRSGWDFFGWQHFDKAIQTTEALSPSAASSANGKGTNGLTDKPPADYQS